MKEAIFLVSCAVLAVVPIALVANRVYHDRIVGRIALLGISFSAWTYLIEKFMGTHYNVLPQTAMMFGCAALFFCWHYVKFILRIWHDKRDGKAWTE